LTEIKDAKRVSAQATYNACISAQIAQATLIEMRNDADYSYGMAIAAATQNRIEIDSGRALPSIVPSPMLQNNELPTGPFTADYDVLNDGSGTATNFSSHFKAVLMKDRDSLRFDNKDMASLGAPAIRGGTKPPVATPGHKLAHTGVPVRDTTGKIVDISQSVLAEFFNNSTETIYFYGKMTYHDLFRSYDATFCYPLFMMQSGTTRQQSALDNDNKCARYSKEKSKYLIAPAPIPTPSTQPKNFPPINCTAPKE
jgi:hypothetical protein